MYSGLKEKTEKKLKDKEDSSKKLSPWEDYRQKKKMKRLEKKEARLVSVLSNQSLTEAGLGRFGKQYTRLSR